MAASRVVNSRLRDVSYNPSALQVIFYLRDVYRQTTAGQRPLVLFWKARGAEGFRIQTMYKGDTSTYFDWTYNPNTRSLIRLPEMANSCIIL